MLGTLFEAFMIILFGISWPFNVMKSWRSRTTKGKSLVFLVFIFAGYICGITAKLIAYASGSFFNTWLQHLLFCFYCFNLVMVGTDLVLYFRNKKLDMGQNRQPD